MFSMTNLMKHNTNCLVIMQSLRLRDVCCDLYVYICWSICGGLIMGGVWVGFEEGGIMSGTRFLQV